MVKILQTVSNAITTSLERFFYFWGYSIAKRPWLFISACFIMTVTCCIGLVNFYRESRPERLLIPYLSSYYNTTVFLTTNFPPPFRQQFSIVTADDVLQPQVIQKMLQIHQKVLEFTISSGTSWKDHCFKLPVVTSMDENLEILKGFRNRVIMKREIGKPGKKNSSNNMDPLDIFDDDFLDGAFDNNPVEKTVLLQKTQETSTQTNDNSDLQDSDFDDFENEFGSNTAFGETFTNKTDFSVALPTKLYCALVESVPRACWEFSLLELWKYDPEVIGNLTKDDIVYAVNTIKKSPVFGLPTDYLLLLGGITYDLEGKIISATTLMNMWHVQVNYSNIDTKTSLLDTGLCDPADPETLEWESIFIDSVLKEDSTDGPRVFVRAWRSIGDSGASTLIGAVFAIILGGITMFGYILLMMSDVNVVDTRIISSMMGVVAVGLSFVSTIGICSAFGIFFGPLHLYIGIILLGLGVDDMFVIAQCYNTLSDTDKAKTLPEKIGLTMKHAGASITVTSFTNSIAFSVGSFSIFPSLSSLCLYLAVGVIFLYIYQATFFVGFFVIEQKRISQNRNSIIICYKHPVKSIKLDYISIKTLLQLTFNKCAPLLEKKYIKILVITISVGIICTSGWGMSVLEVKFQPEWLVSKDSYLTEFNDVYQKKLHTHGEEGMFILANINYTSEMEIIENIVNKIKSLNSSISVLDDWYTGFKEFVNINFDEDVPHRSLPEDKFLLYLGKYLFSPNGAQHQKSFRFEQPLVCGQPAPPFQLSLMPFRMQEFEGAKEHVPGMGRIKNMMEGVSFKNPNSWCSAWALIYIIWEADENIFDDTVRNVIMATIGVSLCTLISLANIPGCILVMLCVLLTLLEVFGSMHMLDIQINALSSLALVLAIGMSVDFAVHIVHNFLIVDGTRNNRAMQSFRDIGPAVFNGGISTLIAYTFLLLAKTVALDIVMKTCVLLLIFGLFNGLILLPVLLSIVGPAPYTQAKCRETQNDNDEDRNSTDHMLLEHKETTFSQDKKLNILPEEEKMINSEGQK